MNDYYFYYETGDSPGHCFVTTAKSRDEAMSHFYHEVIESEGINGTDRDDIQIIAIVKTVYLGD